MRTKRLQWWGTLVVAATGATTVATACGETVAPTASSRDLEFTVPATSEVGARFEQRSIESPYATTEVGPSLMGMEPLELAYLHDWYVKGWFEGSIFVFEYGLAGFGTGYTLSARVLIIGPDGRNIINQSALGRSEDVPVPLPMRPTVQERIDIGITCGARATVGASFEVRLAVVNAKLAVMRANRTASDISYQPACEPPPPQGGGGADDDWTVWLCWYEVWYNLQGRILGWEELSCTKLGGGEY